MWHQSRLEHYRTPLFAQLRKQCFQRDGYRCRLCNRKGRIVPHHRKYPIRWSEDRVENLTTLCTPCHAAHHRRMDWRGLGDRLALILMLGLVLLLVYGLLER